MHKMKTSFFKNSPLIIVVLLTTINRFRSRLKQTVLAKLEALMDLHVKHSEVVMFLRVFSRNELRDFFEFFLLLNKKIVDIQPFNLKSLLRGSKRNKRMRLNTKKQSYFCNHYYHLPG